MTVNARQLANGKFRVDIRFRWPDESIYRERPNIDAASLAAARKWGERRERELVAEGKPKPVAPVSDVLTVAKFAPDWIDKHARANLHKRSGIEAQESILRLHILPFIGAKRLDEVTDDVRASLQATWIKGGYTDERGRTIKGTEERKTINNRLTVLASMLRKAIEWRTSTGLAAMPCTIKLLKSDTGREAAFYDHATYETLAATSAKMDPRYHAAILLAGDGGLRRGEILALNLSDVDFARGRLIVRRSVYWRKKVRYEDAPKGGTTKKRANLPQTGRLHVFRHSFASHLAMAGVPAMTIKELARHESLSTTLRYMHLSPSAKDEGIAMLEASRAKGGKPVGSTKAG